MALFHTTVLDNQIKALPTVDTASGSVATFDTDMTENLIEVKCQVVAQQSGSGTPSPDNQRAIITYNQLNLAHIGNTDKMSWLQGVTSGIYGIVDLGTLQYRATTFGLGSGFISPNIPNAIAVVGQLGKNNAICSKYTLVANGELNSATIDKVFALGAYWTGGANLYIIDSAYSTPEALKTALSGVYLIYELETPTFPTTYTASDFNAMLADFGIDGSLYNIPFGQIVAKGTLNVGTGVLRVTHGYVDNLSTSLIGTTSLGVKYADVPLSGLIRNANAKSNMYQWIDADTSGINYSFKTYGNALTFYDNNFTDITTANLILSNLQVVYELATPIEIQLDSVQIQALLNENNIWCDTNGDTSVKYILSVGKAIS